MLYECCILFSLHQHLISSSSNQLNVLKNSFLAHPPFFIHSFGNRSSPLFLRLSFFQTFILSLLSLSSPLNTHVKDMASVKHLFFASCIILFCFILTTTTASTGIVDDEFDVRRMKRGIGDNMGCPPFEQFAKDCANQFALINRTEAVKDEPEWDASTCCYVAAARRCIQHKVAESCNETTTQHLSEGIRMTMGKVDKKCTQYAFFSPSCLLEFFFAYILIGGAAVGLILIGVCLGVCLCR